MSAGCSAGCNDTGCFGGCRDRRSHDGITPVGMSADTASARAADATPPTRGQSRVLQPGVGTPAPGSHQDCDQRLRGYSDEVERLQVRITKWHDAWLKASEEMDRRQAELTQLRSLYRAAEEEGQEAEDETERLRALVDEYETVVTCDKDTHLRLVERMNNAEAKAERLRLDRDTNFDNAMYWKAEAKRLWAEVERVKEFSKTKGQLIEGFQHKMPELQAKIEHLKAVLEEIRPLLWGRTYRIVSQALEQEAE